MNPFSSGTRLRDMIRAIRACKTAAEERGVVRKECAAIRAAINENDHDYRHRNLAKLMFIHMLGYPTHFGQMECLKLIASAGFPEKRIGYLGLMLLLDERQEVLMLVTNSLKQDLNHTNQYIVGLALCALGNICSAEMARDLAPEVERLLQFRDPNIRKKAALCSIRIIKKVPELAENFINPAAALLKEKHHGVLITGVQLCTDLCKISEEALEYFRLKCTEGLVKTLKDLVNSPYAPEYDIAGITDPFLHIRLLKLLRVLGQGDEDASECMNDILAQVATKTESNKNAGNAILYECVATIMSIEDNGGLRVLAINILGRFLSNRDNNIRYVALNMLMRAITVDAQAVQRHRATILECVKDLDASIRKRALELVYVLVNETNVKPLTKELIDYLEVSDEDFKGDLTAKICSLVKKFSPEKIWYIDQMLKVLSAVPKLSIKAHDGGVVAVELSRVIGAAPQLISIGADKTLAIWDTISFKELRRIKPVSKLACHSVASWCHPRAPNLDILTCVKDSNIWAIEHPTYSALTRPLCELSSLIPPHAIAPNKKIRVYCMVAHPLQPHLVATGTNVGIIISEFDPKSLPAVAPLLTPSGSREHSAVYVIERELKLINFQLSQTANPTLGNNASLRGDSLETLHVKQIKKHISTPVPHDSYSVLSVSSSGKYLSIVWPDIPYFSIYKVSDWSIVDSGSARLLAWDTCRDRFAILESTLPPRIPVVQKGSSSRKAKEAAAAAAQAAAAAASAASAANVQVRILLDDGTSNILMRSIGGRSEPVIGLHGGALLGVAYRTSRRISPVAATAISTIQSMPLSGFGGAGVSSFSTFDDGFSSHKSPAEATALNFQLYSWETFQPVGGLLPHPEWTAWDQTVEYCAFAYQKYIVISSLRPQYRYLGDVAIPYATGAVWHRRQLFVVTPTTIECVFVDAGVAAIDIETKKRKEEMLLKEAQAKALAVHGDLALIAVDGPQSASQERIALRPPMLQVVRLASFQHAPSVPPFLTLSKQSRVDGDDSGMAEERKVNEVAVGGGGVSVAVTRFPVEQKRPVGPLVVVGVKDGVLWLIDRYMSAHALSLSHPGIRCRCLAAYGDAVSAVKWASRLGREHHDDLAQFLLGMGYATEALHLPGISKRLEFDLAMQSSDLKRALQCLLTMSNSRDLGQDNSGFDLKDILTITTKKENILEAVQGIVKFTKEFLDLIDAADATGQAEIAREALKRLAAAASVKGALQGHELRGQALRLANHGELTRLSNLVNNLISIGAGREAAFAAAVLGDNALMEKAWQDTGMLAEAVLHAHAHGRPTLKNLVQAWNKMLQKEVEHTPLEKTDAAAAFLASLEEPKLTSLADAAKKPPIEILPPGMPSLTVAMTVQKKPPPGAQNSQPQLGKPLLLEAAPATTPAPSSAPQQSESGEPTSDNKNPVLSADSNPTPAASGESVPENSKNDVAPSEAPPQAPQSDAASQVPQSDGASQEPQADTSSQAPQPDAASQAPQPDAASQAPQPEAQSQGPQPEAPSQGPQPEAPSQAPQPEAPSPAVQHEAPSQTPQTEAPSQAPQTEAPSQVPQPQVPIQTPPLQTRPQVPARLPISDDWLN